MNYLWLVGGDRIGQCWLCPENDGQDSPQAAPPLPAARSPIVTTDGPFAETKG